MTQSPVPDDALLQTAAAWASRRAEAPLSTEDEAAFAAWLDETPLHAHALEQVDIAYLSLAAAANSKELVTMRAAALARARRAGRTRVSFSMRGLAAAAALLIAVVGGLAAWKLTPQSYETGIGERRVVSLEDGSRISLDGDTEVRVRYLGNRRELWLEHGRAKFDVAHNPLRPFSVAAADRTVIATGTSFSVELVNREMRVVLYEGSVAVLDDAHEHAAPAREERAALAPGQELIAALGPSPATSTVAIDPVRSRSWEGGQLVFDDEPLPVAVERMNRYVAKPFSLGDDAVQSLRISGVYNAGDSAAFTDGVTALLPVTADVEADRIVLSADPAIIFSDGTVNSEN